MKEGSFESTNVAKAKILIISDEPELAKVWGFSIEQLGLDVSLTGLPKRVADVIARETPDLIIIEDFNDEIEELDLCRELRTTSVVPIMFMTNKISEGFQLDVYKAGADECIPYPITPRLFLAKVNAWLRRTMQMPTSAVDEVEVGGFRLDVDRKHLIKPCGGVVRLTTIEARLLFLLMTHPNRSIEGDEVTERIWGYYGRGDTRLLKNHVYRLRRKIETDPSNPRHLLTLGNNGYMFKASNGRGKG